MAHNASRLNKISQLLEVPIIATKHVPKAFGDFDPTIVQYKDEPLENQHRQVFEKHVFSMLNELVSKHLQEMKDSRQQVVLYGCETHVCIKQTALDLLEKDYGVTLVVDAISSMTLHDRNVGL